MRVARTVVVFLGIAAAAHAQGLYGDDASGDLNSQDYWWAKFDDMMLDLAIKQRQPEGRIGFNLVGSIRRLEELAKQYPKHEGIKKWRERAEAVKAKVDPNADRQKALSPECPWEEPNFAQYWVNLHRAQSAYDAKDYPTALLCIRSVIENYDLLAKPGRMKDYPEDLRQWVHDSKKKSEPLEKNIRDKTGTGTASTAKVIDADVLGGDLNSEDYWVAKFDDMMLAIAVETTALYRTGRVDGPLWFESMAALALMGGVLLGAWLWQAVRARRLEH